MCIRDRVQTGQTHRSRGDCWEIEESTIEEAIKSPKIFKKYFLPAIAIILLIVVVSWLVSKAGGDRAKPTEDSPTATQQEESLNRKDSEVIVGGQGEEPSGEEVHSSAPQREDDRLTDGEKRQTEASAPTESETVSYTHLTLPTTPYV